MNWLKFKLLTLPKASRTFNISYANEALFNQWSYALLWHVFKKIEMSSSFQNPGEKCDIQRCISCRRNKHFFLRLDFTVLYLLMNKAIYLTMTMHPSFSFWAQCLAKQMKQGSHGRKSAGFWWSSSANSVWWTRGQQQVRSRTTSGESTS